MRPRWFPSAATRGGIALVAIILAACGPSSTPNPSDLGSTAPSAEASGQATAGPSSPGASPSAPSASPTSAGLALQANIAVQVSVPILNVRASPSTSAKKVGSMASGDVAVLLGYGGIKAGGYIWFQAGRVKGLQGPLPALPADPTVGGTWTDLTGWIAAGTGSATYVTALAPRCSAAASTDLGMLSAMLPGEQLACLGKTPLVLQGTFGCGGCGGAYPGTFKPAWLATPSLGFLSVDVTSRVGPAALWFPPGVAAPAEGKIIRVHAHLDDARATGCAISVPTSEAFDAPLVAVRSADAILDCQQHLVVDSYEVLGADPSFNPA